MKCIVGKKLGMTTIYDAEKGALSVTLLECLPNTVSLLRTPERDGYTAVQVTYPLSSKKQAKKELRLLETPKDIPEVGAQLTLESFSVGDKVMISGTTKGKGFQGVVKRHGFKGGPASHGHKDNHRMPGSIGSGFPEHVFKGRRMGGRMGGVRATTRGSRVEYVDVAKNILGVRGSVPGALGSSVMVSGIE